MEKLSLERWFKAFVMRMWLFTGLLGGAVFGNGVNIAVSPDKFGWRYLLYGSLGGCVLFALIAVAMFAYIEPTLPRATRASN